LPVRRLALSAMLLLAALASGCSHPRTIVVVCRSMAFFLAGDATPNPTIQVMTGEAIVVDVRNEDGPGVLHDFAIDSLGVASGLLQPGQAAQVKFTAPDRAGPLDYYCRPHALTMRGVVNVVAR
jgi:copper binding plastocyanin/azurin family protein